MDFNPTVNSLTLPTIWEYSIRKTCPTCQAEPMTPCHAPTKNRRANRRGDAERDHARLHLSRQNLGAAHWTRDRNAAPGPENRDPNACYHSLAVSSVGVG